MKIRLVVDTGFVGGEHEDFVYIPDEEWEAMSEEDRADRLSSEAQGFMENTIEYYAEIVED